MHILKRDQYSRARGGSSRLLLLSCSSCSSFLTLYQKDGPGPLLRLYLDRMHGLNTNPSALSSALLCPQCQHHLGNLCIYKKENRPAYVLKKGSIKKSLHPYAPQEI